MKPDLVNKPQPGPELTPQKYWVKPEGEEPGVAMFITDRDRLLVWIVALAAPLAIAVVLMVVGPALFGIALALFILLIGAGMLVARTKTEAPPSGLWAVDEEGWPVRFIARKPPPELRRDRGFDREAFVRSVRSQKGA